MCIYCVINLLLFVYDDTLAVPTSGLWRDFNEVLKSLLEIIKILMRLMGSEFSSFDSMDDIHFCNIIVVGPKSGDDCLTALVHLPPKAKIIAFGNNLEELEIDKLAPLETVSYNLLCTIIC